MLRIEYTKQFKRDFKREEKGRYQKTLRTSFKTVLNILITEKPLPRKYFDHALTGNWKDHRDCHVKPDLILIYRKIEKEKIQLVRLGTHSELGL